MPEVNYRSGLGTGAFLSIVVGEYLECDDSDFTLAAVCVHLYVLIYQNEISTHLIS